MSDNDQQPEEMRPIPDGGLQEAMPSWLKRPPAWRNMPTAEQRHERTLPEPDASLIDPRTLVDVTDLPQWLQRIAARGDVPIPEPDESVGHAVQQIQAVQSRSAAAPASVEEENSEEEIDEPDVQEPVIEEAVEVETSMPETAHMETIAQPSTSESTSSSSRMPLITASIIAMVVLAIALAYFFL